MFSSERRAIRGDSREQRLEQEEDLVAAAKAIIASEKRLEREERAEKKVEGAVRVTSNQEKKEGAN